MKYGIEMYQLGGLFAESIAKFAKRWYGGVFFLATLLLAASSATAANGCVIYSGLKHCPLGDAVLKLKNQGNQLDILNPNQNADSGMTVEAPNSTFWQSQFNINYPGSAGDHVEFASVSTGIVTSEVKMKPTKDGVKFGAIFTASEQPTYKVEIYAEGVLQGGLYDIPSGVPGGGVQSYPALAEYDVDIFDAGLFIVMPNGACQWLFRTNSGSDVRFQLMGGKTFIGDEIRITEQVKSAGAYPYTSYDRILVKGKFNTMLFLSESAN